MVLHFHINYVIVDSYSEPFFFSELESHTSRSPPTHKSKRKRVPILSNPAYKNLHFVNKNFQPDFHKDGKKSTHFDILITIFVFVIIYDISLFQAHILPQYHNTLPNTKVITT